MDVVVSILAAVLSIVFYFYLPGNWNIIAATLTAAVAGVIIENAV